MERSTCSFTVEVSDRFGRRKLDWKDGNAEDFSQIFGPEAGQALIRAVDEPTALQVVSDASRYQQLSPSQRAALAAHLAGSALPPLSAPTPPALPPSPPAPPTPSPTPSPFSDGGLVLDAQAFTVPPTPAPIEATPETPKPPLTEALTKEVKEAKSDWRFLLLVFCFLCTSLAAEGTLLSLRRFVPAQAIGVIDAVNPIVYLMKFLGKKP